MTFKQLQELGYELTRDEIKSIENTILSDYRKAIKSINDRLKTIYAKYLTGISKDQYYSTLTQYNRLNTLLDTIKEEYKALIKTTGNKTIASVKLGLFNIYYRQQYSINWPLEVNTVFSVLRPEIEEAAVFGIKPKWDKLESLYGDVNNYLPKSGTLLNELIISRRPATIRKLETTLRNSLLLGDSYTKTATVFKDILGSDYKQALRIVRTESNRVLNIGALAATQDARNQGVDIKRQIVSTLDNRTRPQSATVDGQIENKDGYFVYPSGVLVKTPGNSGIAKYDIQDRESVIDIVNNESVNIRRAKNPVTGKSDIINYTTFNQWAKENNLRKNIYGQYYT